MDGYSAAQVRAAEEPLIAAGVPLMARAAHALADVVDEGLRTGSDGPVLVLAGSGNNGGDALFAAAELADGGWTVLILPVASRVHEEGLRAATAAGAVALAEVTAGEDGRRAALRRVLPKVAVVIDGILGTGTGSSPALRGFARVAVGDVLAEIGSRPRGGGIVVVAVDLPSGVQPDTGEVPDPLILPADVTVTFGACKAGLLRGAGARIAGQVRLVDIGMRAQLVGVEPLLRSSAGS